MRVDGERIPTHRGISQRFVALGQFQPLRRGADAPRERDLRRHPRRARHPQREYKRHASFHIAQFVQRVHLSIQSSSARASPRPVVSPRARRLRPSFSRRLREERALERLPTLAHGDLTRFISRVRHARASIAPRDDDGASMITNSPPTTARPRSRPSLARATVSRARGRARASNASLGVLSRAFRSRRVDD